MESAAQPVICNAGEGERIYVSSEMYQVWKATGDPVKGTPDVWVEVVPPGEGPPEHSHGRFDETFLVMSGTFLFKAAGKTVVVGEGAWISIPGGVVHAFHNVGPSTGELLIQTLPGGGMRSFFEELSAVSVVEPIDNKAIEQINERYGVVIVGPPLGSQTNSD